MDDAFASAPPEPATENAAPTEPPTPPIPSASPAPTAPAPDRRASVARWMLGLVLVLNLVAGGIVWLNSANAQRGPAQADLRQRLANIQALLGRPDLAQPQVLATLQDNISHARVDMNELLVLLPFGGQIAEGPWVAAAHELRFGVTVADAAQDTIAAYLDLAPSLAGLRDSLLQGPTASATLAHLLTLSDVHAAQRALHLAISAWDAALTARAALNSTDIALNPVPGLAPFVQRLDQVSGTMSAGLSTAINVLDASPGLLGLQAPNNLLLVELNTDVTRPTGGVVQHYAVLTFTQGALSAPIQLHPVSALDCHTTACPSAALPPTTTWFPLSDTSIPLRDASLEPELQVGGYVIQRDFTSESGIPIGGMVIFTPALFTAILGAIGPVTLSTPHATFTAQNAQSLLSFYRRNPRVVTPRHRTAVVDADMLLAQAVVARLATLDTTLRAALGTALARAVATKDVQFYTANAGIEASLVRLGVAGSVSAPAGDGLYLVDTNVNGLPAGPFVHESASDTVTLDALGGATHRLRITYSYDAHPQGLPSAGPVASYTDVVRAILPNATTDASVLSGCAPISASQSYHSVLACQVSLLPGAKATIEMTWHVPNVYALPTSVASAPQDYTLLVQRQPGSEVALSVSVTPPRQYPFATAAAPGHLVNGALQWAESPLLVDTSLRGSFAPATFAP